MVIWDIEIRRSKVNDPKCWLYDGTFMPYQIGIFRNDVCWGWMGVPSYVAAIHYVASNYVTTA